MAFPPKKSGDGKSKKPGGSPDQQPQAGPPVPVAPQPQQPPLPGAPMDPFAAMQGGGGPPPPLAPPGLAGSPMLPPGMGGEPDMDDNPMLMALLSGAGGGMGSDPYATMPGESQIGFQGAGVADPKMGLEEMIKLLMLAQAGVAPGSPVMSSSGLVSDPPSNPMAGFGPPGGGTGFGMY